MKKQDKQFAVKSDIRSLGYAVLFVISMPKTLHTLNEWTGLFSFMNLL